MDKHALMRSIEHQLELLARAVDQPDCAAIAPGDLVQIAPDADPTYGRYFLHVYNVSFGRARGPVLTTYRQKWKNVLLEHCARIGPRIWPEPNFGFQVDPVASAEFRKAEGDAYTARYAAIAATRAATIARDKAYQAACAAAQQAALKAG